MAEYIERASIVGALTSSDAQATIRAMTGRRRMCTSCGWSILPPQPMSPRCGMGIGYTE